MVNRSARVEAAAAGGQVLVSASAWAALQEYLEDKNNASKYDIKPIGEFELKGLEGKEFLTQCLPIELKDRSFAVESKKEASVDRGPSGFFFFFFF